MTGNAATPSAQVPTPKTRSDESRHCALRRRGGSLGNVLFVAAMRRCWPLSIIPGQAVGAKIRHHRAGHYR